ncbi:MAG: hypothetical protein RJA49_2265 [Actinomycetota bacterium]
MNPYILRSSDPFAAPPYRAGGVTFHSFAVRTGFDSLNALLAAELGAVDPARKFFAVLPYAVVTYVEIAQSQSLGGPPERQGWYPENDLMVWLLTAQVTGDGSLSIGWYVPLVWVDHTVAVVEGREGFGYPKNLGTITIPGADATDPTYLTTATVFPGEPARQVTVEPVNRITRQGTGGRSATWTTVEQASLDVLAQLAEDAAEHWFHEHAPTVDLRGVFSALPTNMFLLRQLRAPATPALAEVQQLLSSPTVDVVFHGGGLLLGDWTVEFPVYPTLDVNTLLGLSGPTPVTLAYHLELDCTLGTPVPL